MDRQEKETEVEVINRAIGSSQAALCADYRGLTVAEVTELRKQLTKVGSTGRVVKNTLARLAAEKALKAVGADPAQMQKFVDLFDGPNMIVCSEVDPVSPAKIISGFAKDHQNLKIKGGWVDGTFVDQAGVESLSQMPGREESLAHLLSLIAAPATQLVRLMATPATQVVRVIDAQRENLEKKGA